MLTQNDSSRELYRDAMCAAWLGLLVNIVLGVSKLLGGILGGSFALISDAVNSLGDSLSSVVVVCALWVAQKPADEEHPYGHTRAEAIAASNVALLVILSALYVGWEAFHRMGGEHLVPPIWTLWIAGANVVIKEWLYRYKVRVGIRTGSTAVIANAWDHRSDAFCSAAVLVGLVVVRWGGLGYAWADSVAALVVVVAILGTGIKLFRRSCSELMDLQADDRYVRRIRAVAEDVEGVLAVEKLWVRKTGLEYLADIHVEVDAEMTVDEGHRIGHLVKDQLLDEFATLRDVLVHLEPHTNGHASAAPVIPKSAQS